MIPRAWLCLPVLLVAACYPSGPQLSEQPFPRDLSVIQGAFVAIETYLAHPRDGPADSIPVTFYGIVAGELPPGSRVTMNPWCPAAGIWVWPRSMTFTSDSLRMVVQLETCAAGGAVDDGQMELRRRPNRMWSVWRWEIRVNGLACAT